MKKKDDYFGAGGTTKLLYSCSWALTKWVGGEQSRRGGGKNGGWAEGHYYTFRREVEGWRGF